ncbi:50S ribosomal protein L20 [Candidatus Curtissbacteria bacterium RIFCSPHIGHO2_01_FULL_41_44]|uniref:Large ribosomal subunit protein bL20 n=1 Tax=Candidatus Curtissbacteria bacterium RIFCSPLOWO2_01_FULL_42_50 TaxID=1797730 RepID=A0A1F5H7R5_9BACT|nr:MAG: 50S ribosomal protein L20 [Candidatus Curtissbacteria bacterium RIFCSPHIGHO2_01_FULL_41_44]OGD94245.1 MAG: 50S ribosomal protein L20 [Candidatus Curtissbacteria bacterium RIFCSPHIGHO2_02_FULL_42_58]OGD97719.1 MAG: 50S ribosomal protein L20 [Candidatus Curtissbacteria bacterium RIFCSPHIGHO2_12_FULL_42_33]OGE00112.1 MAG: 50S ribosomal protein L20 [Candidatus Curtissbacteria bacterium RIFCSPLOWO2_01_FULL_42_50]OGE02037.1 MAG: 50S ribosomal protein L20 [Candidatus Curtissbacteria bacterium 
MRVKRGVTSHRRHIRLLAKARGYHGGRSKLVKQAKEATIHAGADAYRGRKEKKRQMRSLWITRINAALEPHNISYSQFINKLKSKNVQLDRKILSQIAIENPEAFADIVKKVL